MFNALTFDENVLESAGGKRCSRVFYAGARPINAPNVTNFSIVSADFKGEIQGDLYLTTVLLPDDTLDKVIEHCLTTKCRMIVSACTTLDEVGTCDKRYGATPIGLAHKFGLLDGAYVAGGVYLDKDDIELIVQSDAKIILTPSTSMGEGCGIPPLRMLASMGAKVYLGTGMAQYNPDADIIFEKRLISLAVSGMNCTRNAVSENYLNAMLAE